MSESNFLSPLIDTIWEVGGSVIDLIVKTSKGELSELPKLVNYEVPTKRGLKIPIGVTLKGKAYIDLEKEPNTYIVGTTGSGKSVCVKSIITSLVNMYTPKELELILCDMKRVELNVFKDLAHTQKFVYKIEEVTETIADVLEECENRYDLFMKRNVVNIFEYNKIATKKLKYQVLFIEEIVLLLQDKKRVAMHLLKQLLAICRASGIYVFVTTQRPSADIIDPYVKSVINNRIVFQVEDSANSIICLDAEGAELLKGEGHGILKIGSEKEEFKGYFITHDECKELVKPFIVKDKPIVKRRQIGFVENKEKEEEFQLVDNEEIDLSFIDRL